MTQKSTALEDIKVELEEGEGGYSLIAQEEGEGRGCSLRGCLGTMPSASL